MEGRTREAGHWGHWKGDVDNDLARRVDGLPVLGAPYEKGVSCFIAAGEDLHGQRSCKVLWELNRVEDAGKKVLERHVHYMVLLGSISWFEQVKAANNILLESL